MLKRNGLTSSLEIRWRYCTNQGKKILGKLRKTACAISRDSEKALYIAYNLHS